jgi:glutathione synthase/RimK-type ligase-like ATP-grasp enzyme
MKKIGFLTYDALPLMTPGDQQLMHLISSYGYHCEALVWDDQNVNFKEYDLLVFRNTWDYHVKAEKFRAFLTHIKSLSIPTVNSLDTILANMHKFYLKDLIAKGVNCIPTVFIEQGSIAFELPNDWEKAVIKPAISAGSFLTEIIDPANPFVKEKIIQAASERDVLIQKFIPEIKKGEISLIFINGKFSHAVNKRPKDGDFRIQYQFGGQYEAIEITPNLLSQAENIVSFLGQHPIFVRIDGILVEENFLLMEAEMIEPDLMMQFHPPAVEELAKAIVNYELWIMNYEL